MREYALSGSRHHPRAALAAAGQAALDRVLSHAGDRSAALDLLAADALITLALQAQAEEAPERLEEFASVRASNRARDRRVIDLHSHLLPAVDDGSRSVEQSVKVLFEMAQQGVTDVCLTPHLRSGRGRSGTAAGTHRAFDALRAQAPQMPRLHRGAEIMMDRPITRPVALARNVTAGRDPIHPGRVSPPGRL